MNYDGQPLVGKLLVAPPAQNDDHWANTVIYIYEENPNSTVGLILNRPSDRGFAHLAEHHGLDYSKDDLIYLGGPVNQAALVMLHTDDWICSNTMHIDSKIRISSDVKMMSRICKGDAPKHWRMFLGMAGWAAGQLEGELSGIPPWSKKNAWLIAPADEKIMFMSDPNKMWKKALDSAVQELTGSFFQIS